MKALCIILIVITMAVLSGCATTRYALDPGEGNYSFEHQLKGDKGGVTSIVGEWIVMNKSNLKISSEKISAENGRSVFQAVAECDVSMVMMPFYYTCIVSYNGETLTFNYQVGRMLTNQERMGNDAYYNSSTAQFGDGIAGGDTFPPRESMIEIERLFQIQSDSILSYIQRETQDKH